MQNKIVPLCLSQTVISMLRIAVLRFKKKLKNQKYRKSIMNEWKTTEENYLRDLSKIKALKVDMLRKKLITKEQSLTLFSNVEEILQLNTRFFQVLKQLTNSFDPKNSIISNQLGKFCPFFKIYFEYCENFSQSIELFGELKQSKLLIKKYLEKKEGTTDFDNLTLESLLIKPVQRLPKYVLLLETYLKKLQKTNPDYSGVIQCIEKFRDVNCHNNQRMEEEMRNRKLNEIQVAQKNILRPGRKFLDFKTRFIELKTFKKYNIYFFNDLILLVNQNQIKDYFTLQLDYNSYFYQIPSGKYFFNWIFISGISKCVSIKTVSNQQRQQTLEMLGNIISDLQSNIQNRKNFYFKQTNEQNLLKSWHFNLNYKDISMNLNQKTSYKKKFLEKLQIYCVASEKWPTEQVSVETWYILEIRFNNQRIRRKFTIEEIKNFSNHLSYNYSNNVQTNLNLKSNHISTYNQWKNQSQVMEFRKLVIQEYFCNLIKEKAFYKDDNLYNQLIVIFMKIPFFFQKFAENTKNSVSFQSLIQSHKRQKKITAQFDYTQKIQSEDILEYVFVQKGIINNTIFEMDRKRERKCIIMIESILSFKSDQKYELYEKSNVHELLIEIAKVSGLKEYRDFSIEYQVFNKRRMLDFDEIVSELDQKKKFSRFFLRKTLFFPEILEYSLIEKELSYEKPKRLCMIFEQFVYRFQKGYYNISFLENMNKLYQFCAIYKIIKDNVNNEKLKASKRAQELFHRGIFQRNSQQQWEEKVIKYIQAIMKEYKFKPILKELLLQSVKLIGPLTYGIIEGQDKNKSVFLFYQYDQVKIFSDQFERLYKLNYGEFQIWSVSKSIYIEYLSKGQKERIRIDVQFPLVHCDRIKWQQQIFLKFFYQQGADNGSQIDEYKTTYGPQ